MARLRGQTSTVTTGPGTVVTSTTAPSNPHVGQLWYKPETAVTYQYTSDGATKFWLDISSDGIGTSATKSIDWAGNTDPLQNHSATLSGLAVGDVYYNREGNRYFVCQNVTTNKNKWSGRYVGLGGIQQTYISGTTTYMSHTFLESGTFYLDATQSCDILIVAGGGGGGGTGADDTAGGGGGGGGVRELSSQSVAAGAHAVTVGMGGNGGWRLQAYDRENGEDSSFTATYVAKGGGGGGSYSASGGAGAAGASGGGCGNGSSYNSPGADNDSNSFGSAGGNGSGSANSGTSNAGGGGGGAGGTAGTNAGATAGGAGAAGRSNTWRTGAASIYGGGGGGGAVTTRGAGGTGGGGIGVKGTSTNTSENGGNGEPHTGGGGGGAVTRGNPNNRNSGVDMAYGKGGHGGSGIVIIRYAIN